MSVQRWAASITAATLIVGGGLTVAAVGLPNLVGAQDDPPAATAAPTAPADVDGGFSALAELAGGFLSSGHDGPLGEVLDGLVADATITQDQADAVLDGLAAALDQRQEEWTAELGQVREQALVTVATALGMAPEDVGAALESGSTIGELVTQQGLDRQAVVDELTAAAVARIEAAVSTDDLPEVWASSLESHVAEVVDRLVDEQLPWGLMRSLGDGSGLLGGLLRPGR